MEPSRIVLDQPKSLSDLNIKADLLPTDLKAMQVRYRVFGAFSAVSATAATYSCLWLAAASPYVIIGAFAVSAIAAVVFGVKSATTYFKVCKDILDRKSGLNELFANLTVNNAMIFHQRKLITPNEMQILFNHHIAGKKVEDFANFAKQTYEKISLYRGDNDLKTMLSHAGITDLEKLKELFQSWFASDFSLNVKFEEIEKYAKWFDISSDTLKGEYIARSYQKCMNLITDDNYDLDTMLNYRNRFYNDFSDDQKRTLDQEEANLVFRKLETESIQKYPEFIFTHITPLSLNTAQSIFERRLSTLTRGIMKLAKVVDLCRREIAKTNLAAHIDTENLVNIFKHQMALRWIDHFRSKECSYLSLVENCGLEYVLQIATEPDQGGLKQLLQDAFINLPDAQRKHLVDQQKSLDLTEETIKTRVLGKFLNLPMDDILTQHRNIFFLEVTKNNWSDLVRAKAQEWLESKIGTKELILICMEYPEFFASQIFSRETRLANGKTIGEVANEELVTIPVERLFQGASHELANRQIFGQNNLQLQLKVVQYLIQHPNFLLIADLHPTQNQNIAKTMLPGYLRVDLETVQQSLNKYYELQIGQYNEYKERTDREIQEQRNLPSLTTYSRQKDHLTKRIKELNDKINKLNEKLKNEKKHNAEITAQTERLHRDISENSHRCEEAKRNLATAQRREELDRPDLERKIKEIELKIEEFNRKKEALLGSETFAQKEVKALKNRIAILEHSLGQTNERIKYLKDQIKARESAPQQIQGLGNALRALRTQSKSVEELQKELDANEQSSAKLSAELHENRESVAKYGKEGEPNAQMDELPLLNRELETLSSDKKRRERELKELGEKSIRLENTLRSLREQVNSDQQKLIQVRSQFRNINVTEMQIESETQHLELAKSTLKEYAAQHTAIFNQCERRISDVERELQKFAKNQKRELSVEKQRLENGLLDGFKGFLATHTAPSVPSED